jgi:hypothetical protein
MQPGTPYSPAPPGGPPAGAATGRATTVLVLAIVGLLCCPITSPLAWWMGAQELKAIRRGESPPANQPASQIGMILGVLGTALLAFFLLWIFAFGGLAALSILLNQ